jgi:uncharacterized protein (DUF3820 family)
MTIQNKPKTPVVENWKILFGKYKGMQYGEIPDDYLKWCYDADIIKNEKVNDYIEERLNL